jgi:alkylation response protein AidB-like acyl-CoA dehydrogenase
VSEPKMFRVPDGAGVDELEAATRDWLRANLPDAWLHAVEASDWTTVDRLRAAAEADGDWYRRLGEAGLATPTWPSEYLGLGLAPSAATVVEGVLGEYRAGRDTDHDFIGLGLGGATILHWGTDEQKQRLLPPLARREQSWCQLFSEPGAGSDLASLATRAEADGNGGWVVNGQKVWSSYAHVADWGMLLARTDTDEPKHRGISYFLLDMCTPGVQVRPLKQMTGDAEFNEIFLTDVHVPAEALLGPLNSGWAVAISTLMSERSGITGRPSIGAGRAAELAVLARRNGTIDDPLLRDRLLQLFVTEKALQMTTIRAHAESGTAAPTVEGSIRKLTNADLDVTAGLLAADLDPLDVVGHAAGHTPVSVDAFLAMKKISIAGGTSEIQRNIIGERLLGLPKDGDPEKDLPFAKRHRG